MDTRKMDDRKIDDTNDTNDTNDTDIHYELHISEYYRDEMRHTLEKIRDLFSMTMEDVPEDWDMTNDEHFGDAVYGTLRMIHETLSKEQD